jgi:hypothetical protein
MSSYGRNTFTRGTPCLRLVQCPLYTFAAATCHGALHLWYRSCLGSCSGRVVPLGTSRPCCHRPRPEMFPARSTSGFFEPSSPKCNHLCLQHRRPVLPRWATPAQQSSHNLNSISVFVKPVLRKLPRVTEAARELKSSAWPDVDEASEGRLPQQGVRCAWRGRAGAPDEAVREAA